MQCPDKPTCCSQGSTTGATSKTIKDDILTLIGIPGTVMEVIGVVHKTKDFVLFGISAAEGIWLGALAGALITFAVIGDFWLRNCVIRKRSLRACSAGVIEKIVLAGYSLTDMIFPFIQMHDRVNVVVKCVYWPLVQTNADFVKCNQDAQSSPVLQGLYKSARVCAGGLGATIGALIGVVVGILASVLVAIAIGGGIVAIIVGFIIAGVVVLVFAFMGGVIGQTITGYPEPAADGGNVLQVGDYVTTKGGLITSGDFDGARVYWFVEHTILHGHSTGSPHFSHLDPDANLLQDGCSISQAP